MHSRHGGEKHELSLRAMIPTHPTLPPLHFPHCTVLFHFAGQFASPFLKGYLYPTPLIPTSSDTHDAPSPLQFKMLAPLHAVKWMFL